MINTFSKRAVSLSRMGSRRGNFSIEESIKDHRFLVGACSGVCISLLFYIKARYFSEEEQIRRSADNIAISRYLVKEGRLVESFAYLQLAGKENPAALIELGDAFYNGRGTQVNPQKAYECYLEAFEKGQSPFPLAMALHEGNGCTKSQIEAFKLFVKAGMRGEIAAYEKLSELYLKDTPLGISKLKSLFYRRSAAHAGSSESEEVYNRYCSWVGHGIKDNELDRIAEQVGHAELDAVSVIVRQEEERRKEEQQLLEEKLLRERRQEEERLERERQFEEDEQRIFQHQKTQLEDKNVIVGENELKHAEESKTQQENRAIQDREDMEREENQRHGKAEKKQ